MCYPPNCLKGIPKGDFVLDGGEGVAYHLFEFRKNPERQDGLKEDSVNWEDDDKAAEFTLNQKKADGELQFVQGVAVIPREEIDRLNQRPSINGLISYERARLDTNPYHGNLLVKVTLHKHTERLIQAGLALAVSEIRRP